MKRYSILMKMDHCYVCGSNKNLHIHEVYYGPNKNNSIKYGCCISLCANHHNMTDEGIHFNRKLDLKIKEKMQIKFEEVYPNFDFLKIFGKNYHID